MISVFIKILRYILFIPATLIAMALANIVIDFVFNLINYFDFDFSIFTVIWDAFLKTVIITTVAIFTGSYVFPSDSILPGLIFITVFDILIYSLIIVISINYPEVWDDYEISTFGVIEWIAATLGCIIPIGYFWKDYIQEIRTNK